ncbi:specifically androgen-regulated gene protein [Pelodytes ibericus]
MLEKVHLARHVGMETLGSTGSCDSMESISSNHSAFSGESYDHLSAEERECLMFLEETIDSLDNEVDSGLSNDESESAQKLPGQPHLEPVRISPSDGEYDYDVKSNAEDKKGGHRSVDLNKIIPPRQGYHSFPRVVQTSKEEVPKHLVESRLVKPTVDQGKSFYGKPKSLTSINHCDTAMESSISDLLLLPPPEPFRDTPVVDKRRSVTDPTDAREARFERFFPKSSKLPVYKEAPPAVGHFHSKITPPTVFPRPMSPNPAITISQEDLHALVEKHGEGQFKQGPPTAPKPRKLPPHIIIKPSSGGGVATNLDPQQRPRTFSAHERYGEKSGEPINTKLPHSKEQEKARWEALQKLGLLQEKTMKESYNSNKSPVFHKTEQSLVSHGVMEHGQKDAYGKSVNISRQENADVLGTSPIEPSNLALQRGTDNLTTNDGFNRKRLSIKSNSLERADALEGGNEGSPRNVRTDAFSRDKLGVQAIPQEKANETMFKTAAPSNKGGTVLEMVDGSFKNENVRINRNNSTVTSNAPGKETGGPQTLPISIPIPELQRNSPRLQEKQTKMGSMENINIMSSKDVSIPAPTSEVVLREGRGHTATDKSKRHSSHLEPAGEQYLKLPQGSVPGLRQINIKSNTLERSGVGLSSSLPITETQTQKGGSSFFKKTIFSGNFLRNSRPRPASLGTGKDFVGMEPPPAEAEGIENRRSFFSRNSRPAAPVTSVKITPKGSTDEHRREALKKLGILKE